MSEANQSGKEAVDRIIAGSKTPGDVYLAVVYLMEKVNGLERQFAPKRSVFVPPTKEEVEAYAKTINFDIDGEAFVSFYQARGWIIGKVKMKDWKACVRTWKQRRAQEIPRRGSTENSTYKSSF